MTVWVEATRVAEKRCHVRVYFLTVEHLLDLLQLKVLDGKRSQIQILLMESYRFLALKFAFLRGPARARHGMSWTIRIRNRIEEQLFLHWR